MYEANAIKEILLIEVKQNAKTINGAIEHFVARPSKPSVMFTPLTINTM